VWAACDVCLADMDDVSVEMSNLELELSSVIDLDLTAALNDRYFSALLCFCCCMLFHNYINVFYVD